MKKNNIKIIMAAAALAAALALSDNAGESGSWRGHGRQHRRSSG